MRWLCYNWSHRWVLVFRFSSYGCFCYIGIKYQNPCVSMKFRHTFRVLRFSDFLFRVVWKCSFFYSFWNKSQRKVNERQRKSEWKNCNCKTTDFQNGIKSFHANLIFHQKANVFVFFCALIFINFNSI